MGETLPLTLLLTKKCNFRCAHCMYSCGPDSDETLMSMQNVRNAKIMAEKLLEYDYYPEFNIIGGEPTLDLDHLESVLYELRDWPVSIGTNGWWLHDEKDTRNFLSVIARYIDMDGLGGEFSVRVSQDAFHDAFRPAFLHGLEAMKRRIASIWETDPDFEVLERRVITCNLCGEQWSWAETPEECCDDTDFHHGFEEVLDHIIPLPADKSVLGAGGAWLYVHDYIYWDYPNAMPQGRAAPWGACDFAAERGCTLSGMSFDPHGNLMDICCRGSNFPVGTLESDPLKLLDIIDWFYETAEPQSCADCHEHAAEWIQEVLVCDQLPLGRNNTNEATRSFAE